MPFPSLPCFLFACLVLLLIWVYSWPKGSVLILRFSVRVKYTASVEQRDNAEEGPQPFRDELCVHSTKRQESEEWE